MKKIILLFALLWGFGASAQTIGQFRYDTTVFLKVGGNNEVKIQNGSRSVKGLFTNVGDGLGKWIRPRMVGDSLFIGVDTFYVSGGGGSGKVYAGNGLTAINDSTVWLGGTLTDSITHRQIAVGAKTTQSVLNTTKVDVISNRTLAQDKVTSDWIYWLRRGANGLKWYQRLLYETENDTAAVQYNGMVNLFSRLTQDHSSNRFNYANGGAATNMQYSGVYAINQLYPTKSTLIQPSWFGADGALFAGSFGFGKDSAYDITYDINSRYSVPLSMIKLDMDLNRGVPSGKARVMRGEGLSGATIGWRSYQSSQGSADTGNPSSIGYVALMTLLGSVDRDPFNGQGFTKSQILARSLVDTAVALDIKEQYLLTNETRTGVAIRQRGQHDYSHFVGKVRIGGNLPNRATTDTMQQQFEVYGNTLLQGSNNLRFRGSATGTFPGMYWLLAPDSAGSQASIDFSATSDRNLRGLILAAGASGTATSGYPSNSGAGWFIDLRTGLNGANVTRMWRNGNFVVGAQLAGGGGISAYENISKLTVVGDMTVTDTAFLRKTPLITAGSGYDVLVRSRADSAVYALPYDSISTGGGSNTNLANTDLTQTAARQFDHDGKNLYWENGAETRWYGSGSYVGERMMVVVGASGQWYGGRVSANTYFQASDSLRAVGLGVSNDTTSHKLVTVNPSSGALTYSNWPTAGGGSPAGSDGQIQFNSSGSFGASSNLTWDNTNVRLGVGNVTFLANNEVAKFRAGSGTTSILRIQSPDDGDYVRLVADNSNGHMLDWNGTMSLRINNTQFAIFGSTIMDFNTGGANMDFRIRGDNTTNLFYLDASVDRVGINTNTPGFDFDVAGMINVPGTETQTFRWATTASEVPAETTFTSPTNYIGSSTNYALFTPDAWLRVNVNGTLYGIPAYLITAP